LGRSYWKLWQRNWEGRKEFWAYFYFPRGEEEGEKKFGGLLEPNFPSYFPLGTGLWIFFPREFFGPGAFKIWGSLPFFLNFTPLLPRGIWRVFKGVLEADWKERFREGKAFNFFKGKGYFREGKEGYIQPFKTGEGN